MKKWSNEIDQIYVVDLVVQDQPKLNIENVSLLPISQWIQYIGWILFVNYFLIKDQYLCMSSIPLYQYYFMSLNFLKQNQNKILV